MSMKYQLKKLDDENFIKGSEDVKYIEWINGRGDSLYNEIAIGRSLIMSPFNNFHTWLTTPIIEIISQTESEIILKTENTSYKLTKNE
jgi:hypothetical protein